MGEASLRVAGAWSGIVQVPLDRWSVAEMRAEISRLSGFTSHSINLIFSGKILKDDQQLANVGLKPNSKVLLTRIGGEHASGVIKEKERVDRLEKIKAAAESMAKRSGYDKFPTDDYQLELQNQDGQPINMDSDAAKRAIMVGMMLSTKAQRLVREDQFRDALDLLMLAEESYSMGDESMLRLVDNVAITQIDIVWCLFMLKDIGGLGIAQDRLAKARAGLERSHGRTQERFQAMQGNSLAHLAIYVRLELLEGVVAYHSGNFHAAHKHLKSAQEIASKLDVSDESLAMLMGMGFSSKECKRALRATHNIEGAVAFVMEQRQKQEQMREEDRKFRKERKEQMTYGKTASGKAVDMKKLSQLVSLGYEKVIVAEALKQADNNSDAALDILTDPALFESLQKALMSSKPCKRHVSNAEIDELTALGFEGQRVVEVLSTSFDKNEALEKLISATGNATGNASTSADATTSASVDPSTMQQDEVAAERNYEEEDEIARGITGDPLADYDTEVVQEKEAIERYLCMLSRENRG